MPFCEFQATAGRAEFSTHMRFLVKQLLLIVAALLVTTVASAQASRTATITFAAPTVRTDGSTITGALSYEVWQGFKGGTKVKVGTINNTTATISTGIQGGKEYCWHVVVVEAGNPEVSVPSNEACKAFPLSAPNAVTITVV